MLIEKKYYKANEEIRKTTSIKYNYFISKLLKFPKGKKKM